MTNDANLIERGASLPDEVARRLRRAIEHGELRPGDRLPTQQALCATYGVSRPVVREAISLLKSDGLVISQQGRGQFVNPDGSSVFRLEPDFSDRENLAELLEFLISVEATAASVAAARRTGRELEKIRLCLSDLGAAIREQRSGVKEDMEFHLAILNATHNEYFIDFGDFLDSRVRRLIRSARANSARQTGLIEEVQREHEAIYAAIAMQDAQAARQAAEHHLQSAAARLRLYLGTA